MKTLLLLMLTLSSLFIANGCKRESCPRYDVSIPPRVPPQKIAVHRSYVVRYNAMLDAKNARENLMESQLAGIAREQKGRRER